MQPNMEQPRGIGRSIYRVNVNQPAHQQIYLVFRINAADARQDFCERCIAGTEINLRVRLGTWLEELFKSDYDLIWKSSPQFIQGCLHRGRRNMRRPCLDNCSRRFTG